MDAIISLSTGASAVAAISVIRISGFDDLKKFQSFFQKDLSKVQPRKIYTSKLKINNSLQDFVLLCFFKGPNSYNGENILEIHTHGNQFNNNAIISSMIKSGLVREAKPGEFTLRAYKNKKLNFSQVEGLNLLLNANSSYAFQSGLKILHGELYEKYDFLFNSFLEFKASVDILIDFSDDVGEEEAYKNINKKFQKLKEQAITLENRCGLNKYDLTSPSVVLFGAVNAGKSTLFNSLLGSGRAIVSPIAGTTRDYISEQIILEDVQFRLIDTAGLRESSDEIESAGIDIAKSMIKKAFFKILVVSTTSFSLENTLNFVKSEAVDLVVFTHLDLEVDKSLAVQLSENIEVPSIFADVGPIGPRLAKTGPIGPDRKIRTNGPIGPDGCFFYDKLSIDRIFKEIKSKFDQVSSQNPILIERQRKVINNIYKSIINIDTILINEVGDVFPLVNEVQNLGTLCYELFGNIDEDRVLNFIFENFCIGK